VSQKVPESAERAHLISVLDRLRTASHALNSTLLAHATDWWAWRGAGHPTDKNALRHLVGGIGTLDYAKGQPPVDSKHFPGVICVPGGVCEMAEEANRLKVELHRCALTMGDRMKSEWNERREVYDQITFFRSALRNAGESHLNFWHSSRKLCVLHASPRLISFVWYRPYEIKTVTVADVCTRLKSIATRGPIGKVISDDLARLKSIPDNQLLARRVDRPAHPRANIAIDAGNGTERSVVRGSLPILVNSTSLPRLRPLPAEPPEEKRARVRVALSEEVIVKHLGLYLYTPPKLGTRKASNRLST
jgi:hypothetical protein